MMMDDRLDTLAGLWSVWSGHGQAMTDEQWEHPTRLGSWDVRSLYAHAASWPFAFTTVVGNVREVPPTHASAAALLRDFNRPDGVAHRLRGRVAADAREAAASYQPAEMIAQFTSAGPQAIGAARQLGPVVVDYLGYTMLPLGEVVSIGIVEATVHLLDLQRALGRSREVPADGLRHTMGVLTEIVPPVDFIEAATGRSTEPLFPVMS